MTPGDISRCADCGAYLYPSDIPHQCGQSTSSLKPLDWSGPPYDMLQEQNAEIDTLKARVEELEAELAWPREDTDEYRRARAICVGGFEMEPAAHTVRSVARVIRELERERDAARAEVERAERRGWNAATQRAAECVQARHDGHSKSGNQAGMHDCQLLRAVIEEQLDSEDETALDWERRHASQLEDDLTQARAEVEELKDCRDCLDDSIQRNVKACERIERLRDLLRRYPGTLADELPGVTAWAADVEKEINEPKETGS